MIKVTFGEHDRCDDSIRPETRFVLRAISQKFSYSNFDNDMALLRLNDRVPITDYIRPICLPTNKGNYVIASFHLRLHSQMHIIAIVCATQRLRRGENAAWKARQYVNLLRNWCHRFHKENFCFSNKLSSS
jgi:hypothetical protein